MNINNSSKSVNNNKLTKNSSANSPPISIINKETNNSSVSSNPIDFPKKTTNNSSANSPPNSIINKETNNSSVNSPPIRIINKKTNNRSVNSNPINIPKKTTNNSSIIYDPINIPKKITNNISVNSPPIRIINKETNNSPVISNLVNMTEKETKSIIEKNINNKCPHNSCPYEPRKVLTEKQAEKEPIGSFYHPTKKTYRTGACDIGYVLKRGYERESYKKKNGTIINATYVDPVCVENKGLNGKLLEEYKPIHLNNKNELSPFGYDTKLKIHERLNALIKAVDKLTYKSVILRISALRTLHKNNPHYYKLFDKDLKNLQLLHSLDKFGYKINISSAKRIRALKVASEELTYKKVLSILKKLRNIYKTDEIFQNVFNYDISKIEEYYKK